MSMETPSNFSPSASIIESNYRQFANQIAQTMSQLKVRFQGKIIGPDEGISLWVKATKLAYDERRQLFILGNGASSQLAGHMAADLCKNAKLKSRSFHEVALLTSVANDVSYEEVYSLPLSRYAEANDQLVTISSSGNSPNIRRAIETAKELGLFTVTLSGLKEDNYSFHNGDLCFYYPSPRYGHTEVLHQALLHYWADSYLDKFCGGAI